MVGKLIFNNGKTETIRSHRQYDDKIFIETHSGRYLCVYYYVKRPYEHIEHKFYKYNPMARKYEMTLDISGFKL